MANEMSGIGGFLQGFNSTFWPGWDRVQKWNERKEKRSQDQANLAAIQEYAASRGVSLPQASGASPSMFANLLTVDMNRAQQEEAARAEEANRNRKLMQGQTDSMALLGAIDPMRAAQLSGSGNRDQSMRNRQLPSASALKDIAQMNRPKQPDGKVGQWLSYMNQTGQKVSYPDFVKMSSAPATKVDVYTGNRGPHFGKIDPGYMMRKDEQGNWVQSPVPGSPAAKKIEDIQLAGEDKKKMKQRYGDIVIEDVGRIEDLVSSSKIPVTGAGSYLSGIAGTPAHNVSKLLDGIKSNIGFDRLQQMRDSSPTGGALGQVSERELSLLQSAYNSLEQSQTEEQFLANLNRVRDIYTNIIHGTGEPSGESGQGDLDSEADALIQKYGGQ